MNLDYLRKYRDTILLAEIGALVHDLGKLSEEFIESESEGSNKKYKHQEILREHADLKRIMADKSLTDILNIDLFVENNQIHALSLDRFISKHHDDVHKSPIYYYKLLSAGMGGCDGVDSGIDKSNPGTKQKFHETYISNAFGYEMRRIVPSHLTQKRKKFCGVLEDQLRRVISANSENLTNEIRKARKKILEETSIYFSQTLGETRRAANDVTLWDHSYSVASLYKSALAGIMLEHRNSSTRFLPKPRNLKWKILIVSVNGAEFWMKSDKIGDIEARKDLINNSFRKVKVLIEEEIPLGNEIYCDENCIAFLVFENFSKHLEMRSERRTIEEKISDIFKENSVSELRPNIEVSEESRGAVTIGELLKRIGKFNDPFEKSIEKHWRKAKSKNENDEEMEIEICRVCGLRAVGFPRNKNSEKGKERHMCTVCLGRRENRSNMWVKESREKKDTIWIDEVSDSNNRVALIIGKLDLEYWIDSTYLNTMFIKTLSDLHKSRKKGVVGLNGYFDLLEAAKQSFSSQEIRINQARIEREEFLKSIGGESYQNQDIDHYFNTLILDRERERLEKELGNQNEWSIETKASLLISFLFRKNPSFARTRRVWKTALHFWRGAGEMIRGTLPDYSRYEIEFKKHMDVSVSHTYYLKVLGRFVPTVASEKDRMLIVERKEEFLDMLKKYIEEKENKQSERIEILESDRKTRVAAGEIEKIERHSTYIPYINILREPSVFISIVPAERALDAVKQIKEKYEIQFSKVKNRLPINIYLIFMNKKMPLYMALNSAKRFLEFKNFSKLWKISEICDITKNKIVRRRKLIIKGEGIIETEIGILLGNDDVDYYHPYFIVKEGNCLDKRRTYFETYKEEKLVHIEDLEKGDVIEYMPSSFDFLFLDSNTRRFDIYMENGRRPHPVFEYGPRPYYFEDIDKFCRIWKILEKSCDNTQLNNFESLLLSKIEEWELKNLENLSRNEEFRKLTKASIENILRIKEKDDSGKDNPDFKVILDSVLSGMFFDVKELNHTILKRKLGGEKNE
jgi:CRISPR-associated Csx11 family protein